MTVPHSPPRTFVSRPAATHGDVLFDRLHWRDPLSGLPLQPRITARNPAGVPICGALAIPNTNVGYPIVDCVARLTPELAARHAEWLAPLGLTPPPQRSTSSGNSFQSEATVDSFGFQWTWNSATRSETDLRWRVADRFRLEPSSFAGKVVLDAGAGSGDQSRWLLSNQADVVSVDLSNAIDVVARKLRLNPNWVGVQGDLTALPLGPDQFDVAYCEGVIPFTCDSARAVEELSRMVRPSGLILATHYTRSTRLVGRAKLAFVEWLRRRLCRLDRFPLLLVTGNMAALAYAPIVGRLARMSGIALHSALMPDFKTAWTNTFDMYGDHAYQRYVPEEEFWQYFEQTGQLEAVYRDSGVVVARKSASLPVERESMPLGQHTAR